MQYQKQYHTLSFNNIGNYISEKEKTPVSRRILVDDLRLEGNFFKLDKNAVKVEKKGDGIVRRVSFFI